MQFSDDQSIKGDVNVVARGSSAMLIREQTHQLREQFLQLTANDYDMGIIGHDGRRKLLDSIAEKLDMPGLIPSEEQMQQNLASQQEAQQAQAKIEQDKAQAEIAEKQARAQKYGADAGQVQADTAEAQAETQIAQQMAPLEAQKLLAEIAKLIAETRRSTDGGAGLEGAVPGGRVAGGAPPGGVAQGRAGGMPRPPGALPGRQ